jgi:hypothetical protein
MPKAKKTIGYGCRELFEAFPPRPAENSHTLPGVELEIGSIVRSD